MSSRQHTLWLNRQRRAGRGAATELASLVASPHDLATPLRMPAGATLAVSHSAGLSLGATTITLGNGNGFSTPDLAADEVHRGIWAERGQDVSVSGAPSGTLNLYYIDPLDGARHVIGELVS